MKVLVVGAHPDDAEMMCGGTICLHNGKGDDVCIVVATNGNSENRCKEARDAAAALKINEITFLGLIDGVVTDRLETVKLLEPIISRLKPDIIYTHTYKDRHQDHRNIAYATFSAARNCKCILTCEVSSTTSDFSPHLFTDITEVLERKISILRLYRSLEKADLEYITVTAGFRGSQIGVKYAEAFEAYKYLIF